MADEEGPETTPDGRWLIIDGRRWRATDPSIPEALRAELVKELMRGRRLVRTRGDAARPFVHDAKVALGERGEPWWEPTSDAALRERLAATVRGRALFLLARSGSSHPSAHRVERRPTIQGRTLSSPEPRQLS